MYVFGGCTSTNTTFNDLWKLNLTTRLWVRPLPTGSYPSPKACATLVRYKDSLVLYGGWTQSSTSPLHQVCWFIPLFVVQFSAVHWYFNRSASFTMNSTFTGSRQTNGIMITHIHLLLQQQGILPLSMVITWLFLVALDVSFQWVSPLSKDT